MEPHMTVDAPRARAFTMCPEFCTPPSAMIGTPAALATRPTWYTAVAWPRPTAQTCIPLCCVVKQCLTHNRRRSCTGRIVSLSRWHTHPTVPIPHQTRRESNSGEPVLDSSKKASRCFTKLQLQDQPISPIVSDGQLVSAQAHVRHCPVNDSYACECHAYPPTSCRWVS